MIFREAELEDVPALLRIESASFAPHRQSNAKSLRLSVVSTFQSVWVAEKKEGHKNRIVASAILYPHKRRIRIYSIAVDPACRGEGVGRSFMAKIREIAENRGCQGISLEADASDTRLVAWYAEQGFTIRKILTDYYAPGEDALRMSAVLHTRASEGESSEAPSTRNLMVVDQPSKWPLDIPNVEIISAKDYLSGARFQNLENARVFNLCQSYRYQSLGYYVSLLASARDHRAMPSITTIRDMTSLQLIRNITDDIDTLVRESLHGVPGNEFTLVICFGKTRDKPFKKLAKVLYLLFEVPLLRVAFVKGRNWSIRKIAPLPLGDLKEFSLLEVEKFAREVFAQKRFARQRIRNYHYDLAILVDPGEVTPPSDAKALEAFRSAAEDTGFYTEFITKADYSRIPEFDALFIRETTSVNNHTYLFSRKAYAEGLVVVDDPWSIMRCSNKLYLHERMSRARVLMPKSWTLTRGVLLKKQLEGLLFPLILKQPDGSFSRNMFKVGDMETLKEKVELLWKTSDVVLAQQFVESDFDWRIGVLDRSPLYACKYYMASGHWQIYNWAGEVKEDEQSGNAETLPISQAPPNVVAQAVKAASLIGEGLYGVDLKEAGGKVYLIEVNDNPNIDFGVEDKVLGPELYRRFMRYLFNRIEKERGSPRYLQ